MSHSGIAQKKDVGDKNKWTSAIKKSQKENTGGLIQKANTNCVAYSLKLYCTCRSGCVARNGTMECLCMYKKTVGVIKTETEN